MSAPIALFVYNRAEHTRRTLAALRENHMAADSELFIYSDAAKNAETEPAVIEVRDFLRSIDGFKAVHVIERDKNWGLAKSIISGVSELVNRYGRVIVLEDDLVTSPFFLKYMNDALDRYEHENQVMHVSGYMFPIDYKDLTETFFLRTASCWGWATWARAWQYFEKNPQQLVQAFDSSTIRRFNMDGTYNFWDQVLKNNTRQMNTWAVFWYATIFQKHGLCLHPAVSLTRNIGIDGSGSHCGDSGIFDTALGRDSINQFDQTLIENQLALERTKFFFKSLQPTLMVRVRNRLRKYINRNINDVKAVG